MNSIVGNPSKIQSTRNFKNRVFNFLNYFEDKKEIKELEELEFDLEIKKVKFSEILKTFFETIKKRSEEYVGIEMKECFISISDKFEEFKMNFIKNCLGEIDLKVIKFIKNSIANTISFNLDDNCDDDKTILIVDSSSTKLNLSLVIIQSGLLKLKKSNEFKGKNLSGQDFDEILFDFALKEFKKKNKLSNEDIEDGFLTNQKSKQKLRLTCEK